MNIRQLLQLSHTEHLFHLQPCASLINFVSYYHNWGKSLTSQVPRYTTEWFIIIKKKTFENIILLIRNTTV